MANTINFTVKLNIDGRQSIVTASTDAEFYTPDDLKQLKRKCFQHVRSDLPLGFAAWLVQESDRIEYQHWQC